ncbi:MAG: 4Fe-4S dicluster domain-containing protein [Pseudomonadota bacterium]
MDTSDAVYIDLQKHLDRQAVGFPATQSGVELRLLKHIFNPLEARIAMCLTYRYEPLDVILGRAKSLDISPGDLARILEAIQIKGGIDVKIKSGRLHYCLLPLVVGMYEMQLGRLTPEFIRDFREYTSTRRFGIELISTSLPQMRTIPIARSLEARSDVRTFDEVAGMMALAQVPFAVLECICRKKKALDGHACQVTDRTETCLALGSVAASAVKSGFAREISRSEAVSILDLNQKQGLVLQPSNSEIPEFICSCCGCCCGILGIHKSLPRPLDFWATNFHAVVDTASCTGCGMCVRRCQVDAVTVSGKKSPAVVDLDRCIGCGVCVPACPEKAVTLVKRTIQTRPPRTREELYDKIMARKKTRLGKLKLTGKLVVDAILTGQADRLSR